MSKVPMTLRGHELLTEELRKLKSVDRPDVIVSAVDARGKVIFGSTVVIHDENKDKEITYKIVGEDEADIKAGMISYSSPIARALIGKDEGDAIEFQAPDGLKTFDILEVRYE
jgi:transcription elongation factor GreA